MSKIILFNPRSANSKPAIPNSILSVAASVEGKYNYVIIDGNLEKDPLQKIIDYLKTGDYKYIGITVMPGPQLNQAIPISREIKKKFDDVIIIWGGYFPSNQPEVVIRSGFVDFIINGPGDFAFPGLIDVLEKKEKPESINNLIYLDENKIITTLKDDLYDQDNLPALPYDRLNAFYPLRYYFGKTFLGTKTIAYHSSVGCPFLCSFCGIVPIYNAHWKGRSAQKIYDDIKYLKNIYKINAIEFHDNNFFVSEKRTVEFSELIKTEKMSWWGEGRIDTVNNFKDASLELMKEAGCRMIFFGAESGNDKVLKQMNKGGSQTKEQIKQFAARIKKFDIIPEYSFVLGLPGDSEKTIMEQIDNDINFIREIKEVNPKTEIIIYIYCPVPTTNSELFKEAANKGFKFPEKLDDWINPYWEKFDLRKNPFTPWLTKSMINKIRNFEIVLNGYYPTISDTKLSQLQRMTIKLVSAIRYKAKIYSMPYEIKLLQKYWLHYRQPEIEGFYAE